jgi:hypothetical protein
VAEIGKAAAVMMSAFGTKQTALSSQTMSAFGGKSDVGCAGL